jgi:hypothetical protein
LVYETGVQIGLISEKNERMKISHYCAFNNIKYETVVARCAKAPGIHGYVAGSIPAVTPRYGTITTVNALRSTKKIK